MKNDAIKPWEKACLPLSENIGQAVKVLNETGLKIILVINNLNEFQGTISDGDIRRGLLKGLDFNSPIEEVTHRNALVAPPDMGRKMILQLMAMNKIQQIPVINDRQQVVGLHTWDEISVHQNRDNIFVIMAGGRGTRLLPQTESCPKPLLVVQGKPILEHIIERAKIEGFRNFVISLQYLGEMIEEYFGNGEKFGIHIRYLKEPFPMGTAGALSLLSPTPNIPFIVTNGDVISDIQYGDLLDFHINNGADATMAVKLYEWQNPFGVIQTDGFRIVGYAEKPITQTQINAGVYVLEPRAVGLLEPSMFCDMPTLFERIREKSANLLAYPIHENWIDVGQPDDLLRVREGINLEGLR